MLFMVIEHFTKGIEPVGARFRKQGRMMPDDVIYHVSWMESTGARCFQIMEAPSAQSLAGWTRHWDDLVDFEIIPVEASSHFWARHASAEPA